MVKSLRRFMHHHIGRSKGHSNDKIRAEFSLTSRIHLRLVVFWQVRFLHI